MSGQGSLFVGSECEYLRDAFSDSGRYLFMRCSLCGQQSNEHLIMADYYNYSFLSGERCCLP